MARSVSEVLNSAADLVEPDGHWIQGSMGRPGSDCFCAKGAILEAARWDWKLAAPALSALKRLLPTIKRGRGFDPVAVWNDAPDRTQAEVVSKLREAALLAEAEAPAPAVRPSVEAE